ncbi:hypothetical protein [Clostridium sp. YIM B02569]|uniref:hypothetical protein n=1 Tax=Clostridium sp. YIM B02569 TaxID=2911967 RepID=UPI001EEA3A32|nr:hypothetical protein [Clostridium sp. YIM B02569]
MLNEYDEINKIKEEYKKYISLLNSKKQLPLENDLIYIIKLILFNKQFFIKCDSVNMYYKNHMIYDLLMIIHSLTNNSVINFYQLYRSFIENYIRAMLDLQDNDETGVNAIFKLFEDKYNINNNNKEFIAYIKGEYSIACDYVHSNLRSNVSVYLFYKDILESDEMNEKNLKKLILKIKTLLIKIVKFSIDVDIYKIDSLYYRQYMQLEFLIGNNLFKHFKNKINEIEK